VDGNGVVGAHFDRRLRDNDFKSSLCGCIGRARFSVARNRPLTGCRGYFVNDAFHVAVSIAPICDGCPGIAAMRSGIKQLLLTPFFLVIEIQLVRLT
jgi:hypothetical protein